MAADELAKIKWAREVTKISITALIRKTKELSVNADTDFNKLELNLAQFEQK